MATLTAADYKWCIDWLRGNPTHKITLKQSGLTRTQLKDILQAIETWEVAGHLTRPAESRNAAIETAAGEATTLAVETACWMAWSAWKAQT